MSFRGLGNRGQAGVLGFALVIGIVAVGTVAVVALGGAALDDIEQGAQNERTEIAMTQFDASAARVALGESSSQTVTLPSGESGSVSVDESAGSIKMEIDCVGGGTDTLLSSTNLGAVVYESGGTTLAYQGGGVWRQDRTGDARMVSPPEFHYRGSTLTLPVILVRSGDSVSERVRVSPVDIGNQQFPDPGLSVCGGPGENPVASGAVTITITSEYAKAWGNYFETRTTGTASYPSPNTVVLELTAPVTRPTLSSAVAATAGSGELRIEGTGGVSSYTDSYDSSSGPYTGGSSDGDVVVRGDVELTGDAEVRGNVISGGNVDLGGSSYVNGDVEYYSGGSCSCPGAKVAGTVSSIPDRPDDIEDLNPVVDSRVSSIQSDNDNAGENDISGDSLDGGDITIGEDSGSQTFYLQEIDRSSGNTIQIDTSNGDVTIAVRDYVRLEGGSKIEVIGDGRVNIWVKGQNGVSASIPSGFSFSDAELVLDGSEVDVGPDDKSTQMFIYGKSDFGAAIKKGGSRSTFDGVIYAPIGSSGSGRVGIRQSSVYGAIATGEINIENKANLHYDKALQDVETVASGAGIVRVTYLHVTTNEVEISDN